MISRYLLSRHRRGPRQESKTRDLEYVYVHVGEARVELFALFCVFALWALWLAILLPDLAVILMEDLQ